MDFDGMYDVLVFIVFTQVFRAPLSFLGPGFVTAVNPWQGKNCLASHIFLLVI